MTTQGRAIDHRMLLDAEPADPAEPVDDAPAVGTDRDRLRLIAEVGRLFTGPLDPATTADEMCRLAVRRFADIALVHVSDEGGFRLLAAHDAKADRQSLLRERLGERPSADAVRIFADLLAAGRSRLFSPQTAPLTVERFGAEFSDWRSVFIVPLLAHGRSVGVLTVSSARDGSYLDVVDMETITEIAGRLALALDNAVLFARQADIAHTLQHSLLPASLPDVPGAHIAVRYRAGAEGTEVGGDFYDVIPLATGRFGLVVGDVMGRGVRAAATMGQVRAAIRSYALEGHGPAALLTRLDRLVGTREDELLVTCVYAEWDPARSAVVLASAGHPPPLLRPPAAAARRLELPQGVPLGVGMSAYDEVAVDLEPGALILAYTDGLVESRLLPFDEGFDRLAAAIGEAETADEVCAAALAGMTAAATATPAENARRDDVAMLALRTEPVSQRATPGRQPPRDISLAADPASPARARSFVGDVLAQWRLLGLLDTAELLTSELVTNAVRHAGTAVQLSVSRVAVDRVRVAVTDQAADRPLQVHRPTVADDGGRGLFLVAEIADDWGCDAGAGKTVWFELKA